MALFPVLYVFWQSYIRHPQWKIPLEKSWKCHFQDSKFQNVPRCLGPSGLVPLVRVPKLPKTHLRSACYLKSFWQPWVRIPEVFFLFLKWHLVKILLTGSNYKTENVLWRLHLHQSLRNIIQPERGKQKYCLCCPVYLKGLKLELKEKVQQYFEGSFYMFEKKTE